MAKRELSPLRNAQDTATSGVLHGQETLPGPRYRWNKLSKDKTSLEGANLIPAQERQSAAEPGVMRTRPPGGQLSGFRCPRRLAFQRENTLLTGIQAQKQGCQTSELWEVVAVGVWLLFVQAGGEQPEGADTRRQEWVLIFLANAACSTLPTFCFSFWRVWVHPQRGKGERLVYPPSFTLS